MHLKSIALTGLLTIVSLALPAVEPGVATASGVKIFPAQGASDPRRGRFRVSLVGLTVKRETWDDALERDGKRDEVYVVAQSLVYGSDGVERSDSGPLRSRVMGDPTGRPERILAGSTPANAGVLGIGVSSAGGLRTGDRFPQTFNVHPTRLHTDALPMFLWEGELVGTVPMPVAATNVAFIILTIWEWDSPGHDAETPPPPSISRDEVNYFLARTRTLPKSLTLPLPPSLCKGRPCQFAPSQTHSSPRPSFRLQNLNVRDRDPWYVTLLKGGIGSNIRVGKRGVGRSAQSSHRDARCRGSLRFPAVRAGPPLQRSRPGWSR